MSCDQGEPFISQNPEWFEDELAESSKIDSWAQGAISKTFHTKISDKIQIKECHAVSKNVESISVHENQDINGNETKQLKNEVDLSITRHNRETHIWSNKPKKLKKSVKKDLGTPPTQQQIHVPESTKQMKKGTVKCSTGKVSVEVRNLTNFFSFIYKNKPINDENLGANNNKTDQEYSLSRKRPMKIVTKKLPDLLNKRINESGRLIFDDEGNLISVPKLYPMNNNNNNNNNKHNESLITGTNTNNIDVNNILINKIPIQWRFLSDSYSNDTNNNQLDIIIMNSQLRTVRSSVLNTRSKAKTRSRSLDLIDSSITPDVVRLQKIKNACINLPNTIDLVDLVPGVTISDGEHMKIGQLTNEQFNSILNTNWNNLDEIPSVKAN
ncbi:protein lin-7 [Schistosoma japonicum]|nr:protein lin-7 [Schistosoma japonicum]